MPAIIDVRFSLGAILIGCFIAVACVHPHFPCAFADPVPLPATQIVWDCGFPGVPLLPAVFNRQTIKQTHGASFSALMHELLYEPLHLPRLPRFGRQWNMCPKSLRMLSATSRIGRILDVTHTLLICTSIWKYLIANFGNVEYFDHRHPT